MGSVGKLLFCGKVEDIWLDMEHFDVESRCPFSLQILEQARVDHCDGVLIMASGSTMSCSEV